MAALESQDELGIINWWFAESVVVRYSLLEVELRAGHLMGKSCLRSSVEWP